MSNRNPSFLLASHPSLFLSLSLSTTDHPREPWVPRGPFPLPPSRAPLTNTPLPMIYSRASRNRELSCLSLSASISLRESFAVSNRGGSPLASLVDNRRCFSAIPIRRVERDPLWIPLESGFLYYSEIEEILCNFFFLLSLFTDR